MVLPKRFEDMRKRCDADNIEKIILAIESADDLTYEMESGISDLMNIALEMSRTNTKVLDTLEKTVDLLREIYLNQVSTERRLKQINDLLKFIDQDAQDIIK